MEEDDSSSEEIHTRLRLQFQALQEQQVRRLEGRRTGVAPPPAEEHQLVDLFSAGALERHGETERLQDQLRQVKDENGRLHKLLSERDFQIIHLRREREEERQALADTAGLSGDAATTSYVEISRRNRELTAETERQKNKIKQANGRVKALEKKLQAALLHNSTQQLHKKQDASATNDQAENGQAVKSLQEKLSAAQLKMAEYRNQIQSLKQECRAAQKVLSCEVGEEANVQQLLCNPGGWRGRSQQILALQSRVRDLEQQLSPSPQDPEEPPSTRGLQRSQDRHLSHIRAIEKERKDKLEKLVRDYDALSEEHSNTRKNLEGSKARNKNLSTEIKALKSQISTLLDKGKHDDELVDTLMKQQTQWQGALVQLSHRRLQKEEAQQGLEMQLQSEAQQHSSLIQQLRLTLAEKESNVKELERELQQLAKRRIDEEDLTSGSSSARETEVACQNCASHQTLSETTVEQEDLHHAPHVDTDTAHEEMSTKGPVENVSHS